MFWSLTPRQTHRHFKAFERRVIREHNDRAWAVHTVASLFRCDPKKFVRLDDLRISERRRKKSWQEIKAALLFAMPPDATRN